MLIPIQEIVQRYNPQFKGVIHGGAHWGEEHEDYLSVGITEQIWVEPCKSAFEILRHKLGNKTGVVLFHCACGNFYGESKMYVAPSNQGQSNSLLEPDKHLTQHPTVEFTDSEMVIVTKLDYLPFDRSKYNFLALDVQGAEGEVLKGGEATLNHIDYIYAEVNRDSTYKGNMLIEDIDSLLKDFTRVETKWASRNLSWGDAFWIRTTKLK